ncbi:protein WIR1A-like [Miscanthus floridulus]|uniref:protein WIR1A-like n=1 Tax=Miscanthus floridulus TaxID=154761 RepID=UPI003457EF20
MGRQQQQLCMVFLMAFLVVSTMDAVRVAAGRALGQVSYGALIPGGTPSVPRGQPYTGRSCTRIYECMPPAAAATAAGAGGAP